MKNYTIFLLAVLAVAACTSKPSPETGFPDLSGDYLGQGLPDDSARFFAPGIVSAGMSVRDIAISPEGNEIYFSLMIGGYSYSSILVCKRTEGKWTAPEITPFCSDPENLYLEPAMSLDGNKLFFLSNMAKGGGPAGNQDIWYVERTVSGWSEPMNLGEPVNTEDSEFYPSLTREGHLYFTRARKGSQLNMIYRSRLLNGRFQEPELLPEQVNCGINRFNAFISPDEDYLIIPAAGMDDSFGGVDYYIVFRTDNDQWSEPLNMGPEINSEAMREWSAYVSRDNEVLFFMSDRLTGIGPDQWSYQGLSELHNNPGNGNPCIYWISAGIIDELREKAVFSTP